MQAALDYSGNILKIAEAGGMRENAAKARMFRCEAFATMGDFRAVE